MNNRRKFSSVTVIAGCFVCNGSEAIWTTANAMAVAARHADATGHDTWADQILNVRYVCSDAAQ
ncbi:hypothetical protein [Rhizobium sp. MHM7A]|uniref:hypothetical protein n=1 Tax=Rhizobium sp. MHM7A TaxID=2583233 RepID=UPI001106C495|nr:hypothetical protein [Rhizobium sp. MHM7A]TLX16471.1 hypothetical protein FFR93_03805 [Rhizobium sp. MHM7A]